MWWLLAVIGSGLVLGLLVRWWGLLLAPVVIVLVSLTWTTIDTGDVGSWGNESGTIGTLLLLSLPTLISAAIGAVMRDAIGERMS